MIASIITQVNLRRSYGCTKVGICEGRASSVRRSTLSGGCLGIAHSRRACTSQTWGTRLGESYSPRDGGWNSILNPIVINDVSRRPDVASRPLGRICDSQDFPGAMTPLPLSLSPPGGAYIVACSLRKVPHEFLVGHEHRNSCRRRTFPSRDNLRIY